MVMQKLTPKPDDGKRESIAWCECGDALETVPLLNEEGMIMDYEYYCMGCDETYKLVKKRGGDLND
jgi:hypothetical protein